MMQHILWRCQFKELFPGTQVTIGPVIENGFYYDFARKDLLQIGFKKIEKNVRDY